MLPTPSRRRSLAPATPTGATSRPPSSLSQASSSAEAMSELQSAMSRHNPARYSTSSASLTPRVGDVVRTSGLEHPFVGVLRYLGPVGKKDGVFAGIELVGEWIGKGKNDGSALGCVEHFYESR